MTKYKLEEFKQWLEEKEERKTAFKPYTINWTDTHVEKMLEGKEFYGGVSFQSPSFLPYREIALKWKAEVDTRERERESKWGGNN